MTKILKDALIVIAMAVPLIVVMNISIVPEAAASEYLHGYDYPKDAVPIPEVTPDLSVMTCQSLGELKAKQEFVAKLVFFAQEIGIEMAIEERRLELLKLEAQVAP